MPKYPSVHLYLCPPKNIDECLSHKWKKWWLAHSAPFSCHNNYFTCNFIQLLKKKLRLIADGKVRRQMPMAAAVGNFVPCSTWNCRRHLLSENFCRGIYCRSGDGRRQSVGSSYCLQIYRRNLPSVNSVFFVVNYFYDLNLQKIKYFSKWSVQKNYCTYDALKWCFEFYW